MRPPTPEAPLQETLVSEIHSVNSELVNERRDMALYRESPKFAPLNTAVDCVRATLHKLMDEAKGLSKVKASEPDEDAIPAVTIKEWVARWP